jgi:hypothetical protein
MHCNNIKDLRKLDIWKHHCPMSSILLSKSGTAGQRRNLKDPSIATSTILPETGRPG